MPEFAPGESKVAIATFPVKPAGLPCTAELWLGSNSAKVAGSGEVPFVSTGADQSIALPITMPDIEDTYPVNLDVFSNDLLIYAYKAIQDVVITVPMPSALLISYRAALEEAYIHVEAGYPNDWVMILGYGLQYASAAIPQLKGLMREEAVRIGMISTTNEAYFDRAIMYHVDGTTIIPYWWPCPYCGERLRSPALLESHVQEVHWEILSVKGTITGVNLINPYYGDEDEYMEAQGLSVTWRNDSPFPIRGRVVLAAGYWRPDTKRVATSGQDTLVSPGSGATVCFEFEISYQVVYKATLILVGDPLDGLLLDEFP